MFIAQCDKRFCDNSVSGEYFKELKENLNRRDWKWCRWSSELPLKEELFCKFHAEQFEKKV